MPWHRAGCLAALVACILLQGCRTSKNEVENYLNSDRHFTQRRAEVAERYVIGCPDLLDVRVAGRPDVSGPRPVGVDGCLDLEPLGRPRVEGQTLGEAAQQIAELADVPAGQVEVRMLEYRSRSIYLFGEVTGLQRAVPYQGQETVVDLLRRTGGITSGAAPRDVYVVRSHVADAGRPEVFHVDLNSIVLKHDERTNVRLQPYDQLHVGGTRRSRLEACVPPWLRPCYHKLCKLLPLWDREDPGDKLEPASK